MRRTTITALACLSAAAFPAAAVADHGGGHHDGNGHHRFTQRHDRGRHHVDIGQVTSLAGNQLTITFSDGTAVTAGIDRATRIECKGFDDHGDQGDVRAHDRGPGGGSNGGGDRGRGNDNDQECFGMLSQAGTGVEEARVDQTQFGPFWDDVVLDSDLHQSHHGS